MFKFQNYIDRYYQNLTQLISDMPSSIKKQIEESAIIISDAFKNGNKILIAGNGGSAADAQHLAAEFIVRLTNDKNRNAMPAIALTTDTSIITACSNDYGFDQIFARQIEGLGNKGDIFLAISTSGNSKNLVTACQTAANKGLKIISFLGNDGGKIKKCSDISLIIPSQQTSHIQEMHITIYHLICDLVERIYFS